jgi:hypothetical protein
VDGASPATGWGRSTCGVRLERAPAPDRPTRWAAARAVLDSPARSGCPILRPDSPLWDRAVARIDGARSASGDVVSVPTPAVLLAPTRAVSSPNRRRTRSRSSCRDMAATVVPTHGWKIRPTSGFGEPVDNRSAVHNSPSSDRRLPPNTPRSSHTNLPGHGLVDSGRAHRARRIGADAPS